MTIWAAEQYGEQASQGLARGRQARRSGDPRQEPAEGRADGDQGHQGASRRSRKARRSTRSSRPRHAAVARVIETRELRFSARGGREPPRLPGAPATQHSRSWRAASPAPGRPRLSQRVPPVARGPKRAARDRLPGSPRSCHSSGSRELAPEADQQLAGADLNSRLVEEDRLPQNLILKIAPMGRGYALKDTPRHFGPTSFTASRPSRRAPASSGSNPDEVSRSASVP